MEVETREFLKEIRPEVIRGKIRHPRISELCGEKGKFKLKEGKNIILMYGKDGEFLRRRVVHWTGDHSKVQGSFKDETDIKNILQKYGRTGLLPIVKEQGLYGDFTDVPSYQEAQNILIKAEKQFANLNSDVRKRFDNDPAKFLEFCNNKENLEEMYKLGLANKPKAEEPRQVFVVNKDSKKEGEE